MLEMSISTSLRRAAKLQEKIEELRGQLAALLDQARAELASVVGEESAPAVGRGARRSATKRESGSKVRGARKNDAARHVKAGHGVKAKRRSPLAGRKRASSPSGPLAPAVVKILEKKNKPMNVREILDQLLATGYAFSSPEPKKNLAARIYRLNGVKQVSAGLFAKA